MSSRTGLWAGPGKLVKTSIGCHVRALSKMAYLNGEADYFDQEDDETRPGPSERPRSQANTGKYQTKEALRQQQLVRTKERNLCSITGKKIAWVLTYRPWDLFHQMYSLLS